LLDVLRSTRYLLARISRPGNKYSYRVALKIIPALAIEVNPIIDQPKVETATAAIVANRHVILDQLLHIPCTFIQIPIETARTNMGVRNRNCLGSLHFQ
jgi:hypothetical protein